MIHTDTSLIVAGMMAAFTILFGVRNVHASEQHRGMMLAMAFELVVKLAALLILGPFVLFVLFDGPSDLWRRLVDQPALLEQVSREGSPLTWIVTTVLSGMAFLCLPRQFHAAVVEHGHPAALRTARWLFPSYLVLINLFVLPIAAGGLLLLGRSVNADLYVLQLPLGHGENWLSALVFIGGLSAATSMVVVACMALSAMIGNELLMPYVLRRQRSWNPGGQQQMGPLVVFVRRAAVVLIMMAAYAYERVISGVLPLASIGLISFAAVANFAPGLVLGLYWRRAHRYGVVAGLVGGFVVWLYALLLPSLQLRCGGPGRAAARLAAGAARRPRSGGAGLRGRHPGQHAAAGRRVAAGARARRRCRAGRCLRAGRRARAGAADAGRCVIVSPNCATCWPASSAPNVPSGR